MQTWHELIVAFYRNLRCPELPAGYDCMNPYRSEETMRVVDAFGKAFLNDTHDRTLIVGINPGRFGAGITGLPFTDPYRLEQKLGIVHKECPPESRQELSSQFIYEAIDGFGGPSQFYRHYLISSVYPLGFLKQGKNLNYYELPNWRDQMVPLIIENIDQHMRFPVNRDICICIGKGENLKVLKALNKERKWFRKIEALPHPRWILQYKRRELDKHTSHYQRVLGEALPQSHS